MSHDRKRKLGDYAADLEVKKDPNGTNNDLTVSSAEQADSASNREALGSLVDTSRPTHTGSDQKAGSLLDVDEQTAGEWTVIDRTQKKRKKLSKENGRIKYPDLIFAGNLQDPIKLADLQNIILYTFADGVAPKWVAFKHSGHVKKVVCLMAPGLELDMFNNEPPQEPSTGDANDLGMSGKKQQRSAADDIRDIGFGVGRYVSGSTTRGSLGNPRPIKTEELEDALKPIATIFEQVWPVKAPGDTKYAKIHSPIQAILMAPLPQSQEVKRMKGPRPARESHSFQPTRTSVIEYLLTLDELREAEYPMHPALCDIPEDATTERKRRETLGQTLTGGWVDTQVSSYTALQDSLASTGPEDLTAGCRILALDCEMVLTDDERYSLARISIVDWSGKTILDELVKPSLPIKNYYTEFSGMTKEILDPVRTTLSEIQTRLLELITPTTILLGHSLESDLSALKLTHPFIIDTSLLYPHPRGPPLRSSLKFLTQKYLHRAIQEQSNARKGHDSVEDALAVLDLVKLKCEKGPKYGTSEMSGESIFRRLSRARDRNGNPRTSAIVDHGNPERGYGKDATYAIGCRSDEEIVRGVERAVNGDDDGSYVKGGGVDFTWARMRELESFRGWANNNREYSSVDALHSSSSSVAASSDPNSSAKDSRAALSAHLASLSARISAIHAALPPTTLFLVYSGTGDPREVGRLQALQRQCRREFNTKKWDETTVKWTDVEEQQLRDAVGKARLGLAFMAVK